MCARLRWKKNSLLVSSLNHRVLLTAKVGKKQIAMRVCVGRGSPGRTAPGEERARGPRTGDASACPGPSSDLGTVILAEQLEVEPRAGRDGAGASPRHPLGKAQGLRAAFLAGSQRQHFSPQNLEIALSQPGEKASLTPFSVRPGRLRSRPALWLVRTAFPGMLPRGERLGKGTGTLLTLSLASPGTLCWLGMGTWWPHENYVGVPWLLVFLASLKTSTHTAPKSFRKEIMLFLLRKAEKTRHTQFVTSQLHSPVLTTFTAVKAHTSFPQCQLCLSLHPPANEDGFSC